MTTHSTKQATRKPLPVYVPELEQSFPSAGQAARAILAYTGSEARRTSVSGRVSRAYFNNGGQVLGLLVLPDFEHGAHGVKVTH